MNQLEGIIKNNILDYLSKPPLEVAECCIFKAKRISHYYINPSTLIKEYNKNEKYKNDINNNDKNDSNYYITTTITKIKHSNTLSYDKMAFNYNKINSDIKIIIINLNRIQYLIVHLKF